LSDNNGEIIAAIGDRMDLPDPPFYLKWYLGVKEHYTSTKWFNISLIILFLFSLLVAASRLNSLSILENLKGIVMAVLFVFLLLTLHSVWIESSFHFGIIYSAQIEVRSEPNFFSKHLIKCMKDKGFYQSIYLITNKLRYNFSYL